jgi:hypothetical protein
VSAGLYFNETSCLDASMYHGISFTIDGDTGGCALSFSVTSAEDLSVSDDVYRGSCTSASCYPAARPIAASSDAGATTQVLFSDLGGGAPSPTLDPSAITAMAWQLTPPAAGGGCTANFTIHDVTFVP